MRIVITFLLGILGFSFLNCSTSFQKEKALSSGSVAADIKRGDFRILFYNVENLFDPYNDSLTIDEEFLPEGKKHWTWERYREKCLKVAKVIVAAGGWEVPDLVGLCEIENRFTLDGVIKYGPLMHSGYQIIHRESPDHRGIDVALLYQPERFHPIKTQFLSVVFPDQEHPGTREILYVKGATHTADTLHVFVNHWPSRWGGQLASEPKRVAAAKRLRHCLDSILRNDIDAQMIIMGDFNDYPDNISISEVLGAQSFDRRIQKNHLYNLAAPYQNMENIGSYKYKGEWGMLDQIIVSGALLRGTGILRCKKEDMHLFNPDFLFEKDATYYGLKPYRTYLGYKFHGGFSDHLPVYLDLWRK